MPVTVEQLNQHFSNIITDPHSLPPTTMATANTFPPHSHFTEYSTFRTLDQFKPTAVGLDNLPYWFLRIDAAFVTLPLSRLFNLSLLQTMLQLSNIAQLV